MDGVWEAIEESGLPVSHHIGESPPATPNEFNAVDIGMLQSVAPFRDMFGKYVFGGILDRHPGLRSAGSRAASTGCRRRIQDAEHIAASFRHLANLEVRARPAALLGQPHVRVVHGRPARARARRPHRRRPGDVVDRLPAQREHLRLQQRVARQRSSTRSAPRTRRRSSATTSSGTSGSTPDAGRAHGLGRRRHRPPGRSPTWRACAASAARGSGRSWREQGIDALVLLGNTNVVLRHRCDLAARRRRPRQLRAAGRRRARRRRVAAPVLAGPRRRPAADLELPADHLHGPVYLDFDEGVAALRRASSPSSSRPTATIAIDEWTDAMRRERSLLFADGAPVDGGKVISTAKRRSRRPTSWRACARRCGSPSRPSPRCRPRLAPGVRQTDLTATFLRTIFDAGADANILDPIWQVMPRRIGRRTVDHAPATSPARCCRTERELVEGDVLWVDTGISYGGFHSDFGRTWIVGREPDARQRAQFDQWRDDHRRGPRRHPRRRDRGRPDRGGDRGRPAASEAVDAALLPRPRARHRQRRDALRRQRHRRGVRRAARARGRHGARARADRVGRRRRRLPVRGGARSSPRTAGNR